MNPETSGLRPPHQFRPIFTDTGNVVRYRSANGETRSANWENIVQFIVRKFPECESRPGEVRTHRMSLVKTYVDTVRVVRFEWYMFINEYKVSGISLEYHELKNISKELDKHQNKFTLNIRSSYLVPGKVYFSVDESTLKISVFKQDTRDIMSMSTLDDYEFQVSRRLIPALYVVMQALHEGDYFTMQLYEEIFAITVFDICVKETMMFKPVTLDLLREVIQAKNRDIADEIEKNMAMLSYIRGFEVGANYASTVLLTSFPLSHILPLITKQCDNCIRDKYSKKTLFKLRALIFYGKQQKVWNCLHKNSPAGNFHLFDLKIKFRFCI